MNNTELTKLSELVVFVANSINENDIEKCGDVYNLIDLPQNPSIIDNAIKFSNENGLSVDDCRESGKSFVKIYANDNDWIKFNLYECDEPNYGNKGDVNSLDMSKSVFNKILN